MMWRSSTPDEVKQYYRNEFPNYIELLPEHISPQKPTEYAVDFGDNDYPIVGYGTRDFVRRDTWQTNEDGKKQHPSFKNWGDLCSFLTDPARNDPLQDVDNASSALAIPAAVDDDAPVARAVYYAMTNWEHGWILPVDIDAKDVAYNRAMEHRQQRDGEPKSDFLERVGVLQESPVGYPYSFEDIDNALEYAFAVKDIFENQLNADRTQVLYSGQGAHVYLDDEDPEHCYDQSSRDVLTEFLETKYEIPIDSVVTADKRRVMRMPYTLHSEVSRVITPIDSPKFDYKTDALPKVINTESVA